MIRRAGIGDYEITMEMMINFANAAPFTAFHNPEYNPNYITNLITGFMKKGIILIAEKEDKPLGMLVAGISPDPWLPHVQILREYAWWVEPEARNTTLGYKLLIEYIKFGKQLKEKGIIEAFTLTNMVQSPDFDLEKRGWREVETNYVYEG